MSVLVTSEPVKRSNHVFLNRMRVCVCEYPNVPEARLGDSFLSGSMGEMGYRDLSRPLLSVLPTVDCTMDCIYIALF